MENNQTERMVTWLDEERRKDKALEAQLATQDLTLALQSPEMVNMAVLWRNYFIARGLDPAEALQPNAQAAAQIRGAAATRDQILGNQTGQPGANGQGGEQGIPADLINAISEAPGGTQ